ncbi:YkuS family protein [Lutispora saccharofermentans]|uniref:YkuS family protein n=1 Tax=Lutispora saccharofermentans TaxID=3024236 RepID=A0ABT1NFE8_9FIRM|nr:YkuS family protein [Lutispora saccharofermentans]MCQ1529992.1 YkuS family protein [Lutispora saccharofermentans]
MGKLKVGVEPNLNNVKEYLENKDISVKEFSSQKMGSSWTMNRYDAVVVSGTDINIMGMQDAIGKARVIDASGMSPEEIYDEIINIQK